MNRKLVVVIVYLPALVLNEKLHWERERGKSEREIGRERESRREERVG